MTAFKFFGVYHIDVMLQPSLTGHSRIVTHDVPVGVVPRRLWNDYAEPEMPDFDVCKTAHCMFLLLYSSLHEPIPKLWSVTCNMGLHSVTCHPTRVNVPSPSQADQYSIYLLQMDLRLS